MEAKTIIKISLVWSFVLVSGLTVLFWQNPILLASILMTWGLIVGWIFICGLLMFKYRNFFKKAMISIPLGRKTKFVFFATLLALIEEAITVALTNMAPLFGVSAGQAYITASANYLDVVIFHSVVVFIPMFIAWSFLLERYNFKPTHVLILFGLTGMIAESSSINIFNLLNFGMWILVYGLMVYLPAYAFESKGSQPKIQHYLFAVFFPFILAIPIAILITLTGHPPVHFG